MRKKTSFLFGLAVLGLLAIMAFVLVDGREVEACPDELAWVPNAIQSGGPPKDGIPAIDQPVFVSAEQAGLAPGDRIYGIDVDGVTAAFPDAVMLWHEIVNLEAGEQLLSVTYCPLTRSAVGYLGRNLGVSGQLYNSNLVMYDRATDERIPQILGRVIDGPDCGERLPSFPAIATTWEKWLAAHPDTLVLSTDTGYSRDYGRDPYPGYGESDHLFFEVSPRSDDLPVKALILGLERNGETAAVVLEGFSDLHPEGLKLELGGEMIHLTWDPVLETIASPENARSMAVLWFAWYAQHPKTKLYR